MLTAAGAGRRGQGPAHGRPQRDQEALPQLAEVRVRHPGLLRRYVVCVRHNVIKERFPDLQRFVHYTLDRFDGGLLSVVH